MQFAELLQKENTGKSEILQGEMLIILNQTPALITTSKGGIKALNLSFLKLLKQMGTILQILFCKQEINTQ